MQRVSAMLSMRLQGFTLQAIGDAQDPPISFQAVHQAIKRALDRVVMEPFQHIKLMEIMRLDEYLAGLYERAANGDIAAVDRALAIGVRRARLLGLDMQPNAGLRFGADGLQEIDTVDPIAGERIVRVEIIGDPEQVRREHVLRQRLEALGGDATIDDGPERRRPN